MARKNQRTSRKTKLRIAQTKEIRKLSGYYKKIRTCNSCDNELKYYQKKFCCSKCMGLAYIGENHPYYKDGNSITKIKCISCSKHIPIRNKTSLCRSCYEKQKRMENHPAWKGGISIEHCLDCNKIIRGNSQRCRLCFDKYNKGKNNAMHGRRGEQTNHWKDLEIRKCIECERKLRKGSKAIVCIRCYYGKYTPRWKGGISLESYGRNWNQKIKLLIKKRDGFQCQSPFCNKKSSRLSIHHIDYVKINCSPRNLITLCTSCNIKANTNRIYWKKLYTNILKGRMNSNGKQSKRFRLGA